MKKEYFEWISTWCDATTENDLPRVLLVGDSITRGYQEKVRELLKGVCRVDYIATSYAVDTKMYNALIENFCKDSDYALVHFNHGLHGIHMTKRTYKSRLKKLLARINGKIMLATSTVVYEAGNKKLHKTWKRKLEERNAALKELSEECGYKIDDLFEASLTVPIECRYSDGTHYEPEGYALLAERVANAIKVAL